MKKKWFVGIDISKKTLDVAIYDKGNIKKAENHKLITNNQNGYKELLDWFKCRKMRLSQTVICMEHTGIYGFDIRLFLENKQIDYSMVSPLHMSRSIGFVRGKDDKQDAFRIAGYCYVYQDSLVYTKLKGTTIIQLRALQSEYKRYVKQVAVHKGYLTDNKDREQNNLSKRADDTVNYLNEKMKQIENEMEELIKQDESFSENYNLLLSIKGIGPVNAINTLLYTNNFLGFENARKYACYLGIAPFAKSSGTSLKGKPKVSKAGAKQLKADLSQAARSAVEWDAEIKAYYKRKEEQGKEHGTIMNAVKFKLVGRMFAVIKRGTPYVELMKFQC